MADKIHLEVAYALAEKQYIIPVSVTPGATLEQAIQASGLLQLRREIDLTINKVGIFSRPASLADPVQAGDRVEVYRPLIADPKALRRLRAERDSARPGAKKQDKSSG